MQKLRKFLAAVLVAVMMLSLGSGMVNTEAQAAGTGKLTIQNAEVGKTYNAYRIFDVTKSDTGVAYQIAPAWEEFFDTGNGMNFIENENPHHDLRPIRVKGNVKYLNLTEKNKLEFANAAKDYVETKPISSPDKTATESGGTAVIDGMEFGYYLVYEDGAEAVVATLITVDGNKTMTPKGKVPVIEKTVKDNQATADVGETLTFTITGSVPNTTGYKNDYEYIVKDTMTGLKLTGKYTVTIGGITEASDKKTNNNIVAAGTKPNELLPTPDGTGFGMNIKMKAFQDRVGQAVVIEYEAKVVATQEGNGISKNSATLDYSNNPETTETGHIDIPPVVVKNFNVDIFKHETGKPSIKLDGAKFVLYKEDEHKNKLYYHVNENGEVSWAQLGQNSVPGDLAAAIPTHVTEVTTENGGVASFKGLADGKYFLQETKAPDGYNIMATDKEITINHADPKQTTNLVKVDVPNSAGTELPGTGGIGNTIFYIVGGALILAGVVLLMRKRAK